MRSNLKAHLYLYLDCDTGPISRRVENQLSREDALTEIARAYLTGAWLTARGELARVTGLSKPDAGLDYWALVDEGFAQRLSPGGLSTHGTRES